MNLGLIPAAAPAPQPALLGDPQVSPGEPADLAAAFEATLAASLEPEQNDAGHSDAGSDRELIALPEWLLHAVRTLPAGELVVAAEPVSGPARATTQTPSEGEEATDVRLDSETPDDPVAVPAELLVVVPAAPPVEVKPPAAPLAITRATAIDSSESEAAVAPVAAEESRLATATPHANAGSHTPRVTPAGSEVPVGPAEGLTTDTVVTEPGAVHVAKAEAAPLARAETPALESVPGRAQPKAAAAQRQVIGGESPIEVMVTSAPATTAPVAAAHEIVEPPAAPIAPAVAPVKMAPPSDASADAPRLAASSTFSPGQDAGMTGDDSPAEGQARRSPEFMRFAAALAQVSPAGADESGRTAAPTSVAAAAAVTATSAALPVLAVAPAAAVPAAPAPDAENVGRLVQAMRVIARPGAWEATVRLKPEHFGDVTIALRVERNSVSAVVHAEAAGVRQWLESQEQAVRSGMAEHGLQLERFVVQRDGQRRDAQPQEQEPRRRQPKAQPQTAERFEVVV